MDLKGLIKQVDLRRMAEAAGCQFSQHDDELRSTCPIHGGKNETAFVIYPKAGRDKEDLWKCYACDMGGDALIFWMKWQGIIADYKQGIETLAEHQGVELDWKADPQAAEREKQQQLRSDLLEGARKFYQAQLWSPKGEAALNWVRARGLKDETIKAAGWGFSDSGPALYEHLENGGFDLEMASALGLVRRDRDDFTANQKGKQAGPGGYIVFPHLVYHRCIYLSSRAVDLPDKPIPDKNDKARNLPGSKQIYRANCKGKAAEMVLIVEGPFDAETLRQFGFTAWAMMGLSGISEDDLLDLAARRAVYLSVDSDKAGQDKVSNTQSRLVRMCQALGPLTMVLPPLPGGKDFNDLIRKKNPINVDGVNTLIKKSKTWFETRLELARDCSPIERDERMIEIGQLLAAAPEASRSWFFRRAHDILGMTKKDIQELVNTTMGRNNGHALSEIRNRQLMFAGKILGNFWAKISEELSREDGQSKPEIRFKLSGGLMDGRPLKEVEIESSEFYSMQWIPRDWGFGPILYVNRSGLFELARAIQEVSTNVVRKRVFTYTGWADVDGKWSYLSANGSISADGIDTSTLVDLGTNNLRYYALPEPPDRAEAYYAVKASLAFLDVGERAVTAMLWAAMYAAPLNCIESLDAVLWVYGTTQSGKSTISHLALTHYGPDFIDGHKYHAPIEFSLSTFASIEGAAFVSKDAPLVIDDFAPQFASKAEANTLHRTAHAIVRAVGNRSGRGRSQANLKERQTRIPRGLVIATAENPLTGQSTVGRLIYVPVAKGNVIPEGGKVNERLNEAQDQAGRGLYSQAMAVYIRWIAQHWDEVRTDLKDRLKSWSTWIRKNDASLQGRLPDYFGLLVAAQDLALEAFEDMDIISALERKTISEANRTAIMQLITRQAEMISAESPVRKVFIALASLLRRKKGYLAPRKGASFVPPDNADLLGWYEPGNKSTVWLDTDTILTIAKNYWRQLDENLDIFSDTLRRQIDQAGILQQKGEGNHIEANVYINGMVSRVLVVSVEKVATLYDVQLFESDENGQK